VPVFYPTVQRARGESGFNNELLNSCYLGGVDWWVLQLEPVFCAFKNVFKYSFCIVILKTTVGFQTVVV
jgi:hypothetical protein